MLNSFTLQERLTKGLMRTVSIGLLTGLETCPVKVIKLQIRSGLDDHRFCHLPNFKQPAWDGVAGGASRLFSSSRGHPFTGFY